MFQNYNSKSKRTVRKRTFFSLVFFSTFTVALVGAPNASAQAVAQQIGAADASERTTWGIDSQEQWTQATHSSDNLEIEKNRQTNPQGEETLRQRSLQTPQPD